MLRLRLSLVLTFFAVLALLTNPVAAAAAQAVCAQSTPAAMAGMDDGTAMAMPALAGTDRAQAQKTADPCCDQAAKHKSSKDCAQACALNCTIAVAMPAAPFAASLAVTTVANLPQPDSSGYAHTPPGLKRPPKLIA